MENLLTFIGAALSFSAACMGVIDKYGWRKGWFISAASLAAVVLLSIALKIFTKKGKKQEEPSGDLQSIGDGAETPDEMEVESITQIRPEQRGAGEQSVGRNAKAGKKMSFKNIRQEIK
ncbi:MAG: hypothetical protein ACL93V_06395 [Candidatus Electrothrix sp. YB6]